jgi:ornithine carbamoyltransferase
MDFRAVAPTELQPDKKLVEEARVLARQTGARIIVTDKIDDGVKDCDFLYTDVWVSMGEPEEVWEDRIQLLRAYQVNAATMRLSGNPDVKFLHCLPAYHNRETTVGEKIFQRFGFDALEVTEDVFESPASVVFDQAENRVHTIKAVMVATLAE